MSARSLGRLRRIWFYVHMWIGVGLAAVLIPLSLSGSYLVWRDEIDHALHPARFAVSAGPADLAPQAYLDAAQAAFGDKAQASSLRPPADPGGPVTVTGVVASKSAEGGVSTAGQLRRQPTLTAWLDPSTAKVLDVANPREGLSMWMHDLHGQFFVFGAGRQVVGWFGVAMFVSCLTGLWLRWPRGRAGFLAGFRWRRSPDVMVNLHYLTGFWIAIPLAVLCLTGALIAFPQFTRGAVAAFKPVAAQQGRGPGFGGGQPLRRTVLTADEAATLALRAQPSTTLASVDLPTRGRGDPTWRVQVRPEHGPPRTVQVADAQGGGVRLAPDRVQLEGDKLIRLNRNLHGGNDTGLVWKWIVTIAGLAPALLGVTGVVVWAQRQMRKARMRRRIAEPLGERVLAE